MKSKKSSKKARAPRPSAKIPRQLPALDAQASAYARILADPCNAPLTHPVYSGSDGGYLVRFSTINTYGTGSGTTTAGIVHWVPGAIGLSGGLNYTHIYNESALASTAASVLSSAQAVTPGAVFLSSNASQYRVVAACATIYWAGTELARQGTVSVGNTTGGLIANGASVAPGVVFPVLSNTQRIPEGKIEIRWRPSSADQLFQSVANAPSAADLSQHAALTIFYNGLPAGGAGFVVHWTAVYEYIPSTTLGLAVSVNSRNTSTNTLDHVINALDRTGDWMFGKDGGSMLLGAAKVGANLIGKLLL